ncbi:hypothetical protein ACLB1G_09950 [Oxalobacteraceae bacterium A2-2]
MGQRCVAMALAIGLACWPGPVAAQDGDDYSALPAVEITGQASTVLMRYAHVAAGLDAYQQHLALAPESSLTFRLYRLLPGVKTQGVQLELAGRGYRAPLTLSANGRVAIARDPAALEDDADVLINRRKGAVAIEPSVDTPGLPQGARRLGDLRLECQVKNAMRAAGMHFFQRTLAAVLPTGCGAMRFRLVDTTRAYTAYELRDGDRVALSPSGAVRADRSIAVPLDDASWPDHTLVYLRMGAAGEGARP